MSDEHTSMLLLKEQYTAQWKLLIKTPAVIFVAAVTKWVVKQYVRVVVREALKGLL